MNAATQLDRRVADLDYGIGNSAASGTAAGLAHVVHVLQQSVPPGRLPLPGSAETVSAAEADWIQRGCRLLDRLASEAPRIVDGPLDRDHQYWIATGNPTGAPQRDPVLTEDRFIPLPSSPSTNPHGAGLYTSTGLPCHRSMWRIYLEGYEQSTTLHLKPWYTWRLCADPLARIYEVNGAADWAELLTAYPDTTTGYLRPDWSAIAATHDAVHLTLRAVVAIQGITFAVGHHPTAPLFWDVESTFWLRWCFTSTELLDVTERPTPSNAPATPTPVMPPRPTARAPRGAADPSRRSGGRGR